MVLRKIIALVAVLMMILPATAQALVVTAEYAGSKATVPTPSRFEAIIGYPNQCVSGIECWQYTKGTRSPIGNYPETWYLHVNGTRVKDKTYGFYVMNPSSGWAQHVAQVCAQHCFLDGMGSAGLARMSPRPAMTGGQWTSQTVKVAQAVIQAGKKALPNSIAPADASKFLKVAGQISTESFNATNGTILTQGRVWVTERGDCLTKYHTYQRYAGAGDHFSCFNPPAQPWDTTWLK